MTTEQQEKRCDTIRNNGTICGRVITGMFGDKCCRHAGSCQYVICQFCTHRCKATSAYCTTCPEGKVLYNRANAARNYQKKRDALALARIEKAKQRIAAREAAIIERMSATVAP